ncbi:MAG: hypothetical protein HYR64_08430 [Fimbriimonas ginsengisoli]|uniref:Uncharacterized protein n=1 Tax=Fimbriimonas ginsengisoli TaxID=1005039 RepID=A0A931LTC6_FIMGI|nr:hypothetical protein [Fimbriimonas ginsengisoli]
MTQRTEEFWQKAIAALTIVGMVCIAVGGVATFLPLVPMLPMFEIGLLLVIGGVVVGFLVHGWGKLGRETVVRNCRIMARYCVNEVGDQMPAGLHAPDEGTRAMIRLWSPERGASEYECALPVWEQCGEGMLGDAIVQGKWLSAFQPVAVASPPPAGRT